MHISNTPPLWKRVWQLLERAAADGDGDFAFPVVATVGSELSAPRGRVVVLRKVDPDAATLDFYTDRRSLKIEQLTSNPEIAWTFWDADSRLQCCAGGKSRMIVDDTRKGVFDQLPKHSRRAYATVHAPGTILDAPSAGLPVNWEDLDLPDTDYALDNFVIVRTELAWVDILHLDRAGNTRLAATRKVAEDAWTFTYVVP